MSLLVPSALNTFGIFMLAQACQKTNALPKILYSMGAGTCITLGIMLGIYVAIKLAKD